ncbi:MAG: hypothetical protein V4760_09080 [Bdellovibrionota bacterium]
MKMSLRVSLALTAVAVIGCSKGNSSSDAPAPAPTPAPQETGSPQGDVERPWSAIKIFRSYTGDENCDSIELRIDDDATWVSNQCAERREGELSKEDRAEIETLAVEALDATTPNVCPQDLKLDADYVHIDADPDSPEAARTFDPTGACYTGGEDEVSALRKAMRSLRRKLSGYSPNSEE